MRHKRLVLSTVLWFGLGLMGLQAQTSVNAAGGDASGSGGTVAYSLGQVVYTTHTDAAGAVSQGVQQAFEIYPVSREEAELGISLSVFPNPTAAYLTLHIGNYQQEKLSYRLFDLQGKLLRNGQVTAQETPIDMSSLPEAAYFLNVVDRENQDIQSFKIIKH